MWFWVLVIRDRRQLAKTRKVLEYRAEEIREAKEKLLSQNAEEVLAAAQLLVAMGGRSGLELLWNARRDWQDDKRVAENLDSAAKRLFESGQATG
jgi:hypothetical protein